MLVGIPTVFKRDYETGLITDQVSKGCEWVLAGEGRPIRLFDGRLVKVEIRPAGQLARIYAVKNGGWEPLNIRESADIPLFKAVFATDFEKWPGGGYECEAVGPDIEGGREGLVYRIRSYALEPEVLNYVERSFGGMKRYLEENSIFGIVWADPGMRRYAKVQRGDYGLCWPVPT